MQKRRVAREGQADEGSSRRSDWWSVVQSMWSVDCKHWKRKTQLPKGHYRVPISKYIQGRKAPFSLLSGVIVHGLGVSYEIHIKSRVASIRVLG